MNLSGSQKYNFEELRNHINDTLLNEQMPDKLYKSVDGILRIINTILITKGDNWASQVLDENKNHLQMAYQMDEYLFTHAGVSSKFLDNVFMDYGWKTENIATDLNQLYKYKPKQFEFGMAVDIRKMSWLDPSGDNEEQSPIWIRPRSLMKANRDTLRKQVIQVVGHTEQRMIDLDGKATGGRYYYIDTLGTSEEYLIIQDGKARIGSAR